MTKRYDLIVVGAGPAGLMAVLDVDRHEGVQRKDNQHGISASMSRLLNRW